MLNRDEVLLSGYAKLPSNTTVEAVYNILNVTVLFDRRSGIIMEAEASMITELAKHFVSELLVGYSLDKGPDELLVLFEEYYHGSAKRALETAIKAVFVRYEEYKTERQSQL